MSATIDADEYAALMRKQKTNKFKNVKATRIIDGVEVTFDSQMEARRYDELALLQKAGEIYNLIFQPPFDLHVNGVKICRYYADFEYRDAQTSKLVVEDVKTSGTTTQLYRTKKKHMKAEYGIDITEVTA